MTYNNLKEQDTAILVGVYTEQKSVKTAENFSGSCITIDELDELAALCLTCGIKDVGRVMQNRKDIDVTYYVGKGKVDEIKQLAASSGATCVVFDVELSGSKVRNLEEALGIPVLDRSKIILDIFAGRAQSIEGKMQVELAQLKYNLPRLIGTGGVMAKMKTSVGMRGPGEKKLELDKRTIRDQISALEEKIKKVAANRNLTRRSAVNSGKMRVCIVGYTNSGKSTLLNTIAKADVLAADKLFATLDPKTVKVYISPEDTDGGLQPCQILLTDTVGFINKLPHEFIHAFESTLDEARLADLLLHVIDISNPEYLHQIEVVNEVLAKIGAEEVPVIMVYNKTDINKEFRTKEKNAVIISAKTNKGIDILKQKILEFANAKN